MVWVGLFALHGSQPHSHGGLPHKSNFESLPSRAGGLPIGYLKRPLSLDSLRDLAVAEGDSAKARALFEEALAIIHALVAEEPSREDRHTELAKFQDKLHALETAE